MAEDGLTFRQEELLAYIRREHRRGRHLSEIIEDPHVKSFGSTNFLWQTLRDTPLLELLDEDVREAIQRGSTDASNQP